MSKKVMLVEDAIRELQKCNPKAVLVSSDYLGVNHGLYPASITECKKGDSIERCEDVDTGGKFTNRDGLFKTDVVYIGH